MTCMSKYIVPVLISKKILNALHSSWREVGRRERHLKSGVIVKSTMANVKSAKKAIGISDRLRLLVFRSQVKIRGANT